MCGFTYVMNEKRLTSLNPLLQTTRIFLQLQYFIYYIYNYGSYRTRKAVYWAATDRKQLLKRTIYKLMKHKTLQMTLSILFSLLSRKTLTLQSELLLLIKRLMRITTVHCWITSTHIFKEI